MLNIKIICWTYKSHLLTMKIICWTYKTIYWIWKSFVEYKKKSFPEHLKFIFLACKSHLLNFATNERQYQDMQVTGRFSTMVAYLYQNSTNDIYIYSKKNYRCLANDFFAQLMIFIFNKWFLYVHQQRIFIVRKWLLYAQ